MDPLPETESRRALAELLETLRDADERWVSPEWNLYTADDAVEAHRALMHYLQWGLAGLFERDPSAPRFRRLVTPSRKLLGDNPDTIYFEAPVSAGHVYRVTGETEGAIYLSISIESSVGWGSMDNQVLSVLNDTTLDVDADGRFEIIVGGESRQGNWLELPPQEGAIITRHYFEDTTHAATNPARIPEMDIEVIDGAPPPRPSDDSVSAGIRRIAAMIRELTVDRVPMAQGEPRSWVSLVPNEFPPPGLPGDLGLSAIDAAYALAPFVVGPDEALVIRGRWPECRYANISLWNRHLQSLDYANRSISLNRAQMVADDDGRFTAVIAHADPGVPNWLDTEGRPFGIAFWRFMLPDGDIETPRAELVPLADLPTRL
ncbi:DUF1214 domain-containing protein [Candidatus Poriferisodalis sp.]|uniref:DUF1214 domain-containing protein n=1 Tax=Candidatus Poriferisodalis sp. TaxID=3101277 RepID=UPI003B023132